MKLTILYAASLTVLMTHAACGNSESVVDPTEVEETDLNDPKDDRATVNYNYSEKMSLGYHNPVSDYMFFADPTAVEYNGRLYVYGTNDTQQWQDGEKGAENTFEKIHSFQVVSTEDMVNWTYHGVMELGEIAPEARQVAWAPSIVSRVESDGQTHFYLFYSSSGAAIGLLTATSPLGPWSAPLGASDFLNYQSSGIGDCPNPFDPGVVLDENGIGWLSFGGGVAKNGTDQYPGTARICRLSSDLLRVDGTIQSIPAPYFFEASELNYIGGRWIYIYNNSWKSRTQWDWPGVEAPSGCSMSYMASTDPLLSGSWTYKGIVLSNPGRHGMEYGNNHAHLHKFKGKYYMLYHTQHYAKSIDITGGYRSICIDPIAVNELTGAIYEGGMSHEGINQLTPVDGFSVQPASQAAATYGITYEKGEGQGEMVVHATAPGQVFRVNMVNGVDASTMRVRVKGEGSILVRKGSPTGRLLARVEFSCSDWTWCEVPLERSLTALVDLCFSSGSGNFYFREWQFVK